MEQGTVFCFHALCVYFEKHKRLPSWNISSAGRANCPIICSPTPYFRTRPAQELRLCPQPLPRLSLPERWWTCETYFDYSKGSKRLGLFLKTIDQKLRILTNYGHPLKETELPKHIQQALTRRWRNFWKSAGEQQRRNPSQYSSTFPGCKTSARRQIPHGTSCWWMKM